MGLLGPPWRKHCANHGSSSTSPLSRFISRLAEQVLPFFKLLRKSRPFVWTEEAEEAFQELKRYLTSLPIMVAPEPGEPLLLYITATAKPMSLVLVTERPEPRQHQEPPEPEDMEVDALDPPEEVQTIERLVYYISEVLNDNKTRYLEVHKLLYAILIESRKLCHYFHLTTSRWYHHIC
jgi:hypothetical protein